MKLSDIYNSICIDSSVENKNCILLKIVFYLCKILFIFTMLYHDSLILNWFPWIVYSYTVGEVRFDVNRDSFVQCILVTAKVKQ